MSRIANWMKRSTQTSRKTLAAKRNAATPSIEGLESRTLMSADLVPYHPSGWSAPIVVSSSTGTHTDNSLTTTSTAYIDWAVANLGNAPVTAQFSTRVLVDGAVKGSWYTSPTMAANTYTYVNDFSLGHLSAGNHTITLQTDYTGAVAESNESNNSYSRTINVGSPTSTGIVKGSYVGTVTTLVKYLDPISYQVLGQQQFNRPTTVKLGNPLIAYNAHLQENNPFNLLVTPSSGSGGVPGDLYLNSAQIFFQGSLTYDNLQTNWKLTQTANGFSGVLVNSGNSEAANGQQTWAPAELVPGRPELGTTLAPYSFYDARYGTGYQATLSATVSGSHLHMVVQGFGNALGANINYFIITIDANLA